jgi:amino acid adenylation domain-containing protein
LFLISACLLEYAVNAMQSARLNLSLRRPVQLTRGRGQHFFRIAVDIPERFQAENSSADSLFTFLGAVFDLLLLRYTGSDDIVAAGRHRAGRTFSWRVGLRDDATFTDLRERVRQGIATGETENTSPSVLLVLDGPAEAPGDSQYDLIIALTQSSSGFQGTCEYAADQIGETHARALVKHFGALLNEAIAKPGDRISSFEMLDEREKRQILVEWNGQDLGYPQFCIHELIEQQVERTPDATAVVFGDRRLTYRELNSRANQLAHYLRAKAAHVEKPSGVLPVGVLPAGVLPVGVLMEASLEIVVAVIAILKAGGAYISLDNRQPAHRLREVIEEARLRLVVTEAPAEGHQAIDPAVRLVFTDREADRIAEASTANPQSGVQPDDMAFVRYTSGSTGRPKGAINIHRSITSRLIAPPLPDFVPGDVCLVNTSWGFGSKLFFPLALGAVAVIIPDDCVRDVNRFAETLEHHAVTAMFIVPSHLRQLLSLGPEITPRLRRLRSVTVGGETLTADLVSRFRELLPQVQLLNTYGGSEVGGTATMQLIAEDSLAEGNFIGRPVVNTRVYLLDRDMHPVPPGVTGEICVGSRHIGRGYLNRPDLTEPRFVPDPFFPGAGAQLYRSGDLGRYFPDGRIEFMGRADRQVKVRGFRVEMEEIEAILLDQGQLAEAVVTAMKTGSDNRLIGYVVFKPGERARAGELKSFLRQRVREYMVPYTFVFLDRIPLNRHGKIDMQALPQPGRERPDLATDYEAPRNSVESSVAEIWSGVLGIEAVGIDDNFIELGGDSLLATAVSARMRDRLGLDVPMELILEWSIATIVRETAIEDL